MWAIMYGYSSFAPGTDETTALNSILDENTKQGFSFIADADARTTSGFHPKSAFMG